MTNNELPTKTSIGHHPDTLVDDLTDEQVQEFIEALRKPITQVTGLHADEDAPEFPSDATLQALARQLRTITTMYPDVLRQLQAGEFGDSDKKIALSDIRTTVAALIQIAGKLEQ